MSPTRNHKTLSHESPQQDHKIPPSSALKIDYQLKPQYYRNQKTPDLLINVTDEVAENNDNDQQYRDHHNHFFSKETVFNLEPND